MTVERGVETRHGTVESGEALEEIEASPSKASSRRPTKSEIFDLVSSHRRRFAIHYCKEQNEPVELADLAEYVASRELEKPISELTSDERKRVYTSLQQTHLPRLERAGMISNDRGTVELTDNISDLEIYLDIVPRHSVPWGVYYLGLSLISALVLLLVYGELLPTGTIPPLGWAAIIVGLFAISALIHTVSNREYRLDRMDTESE